MPNMHTIVPATPADAPAIHAIQMRAFAEEARLSGTSDIPPLTEDLATVQQHIRIHTVLTARDGERIMGSARGIVEGEVCTICRVSIDLPYQGRGLGSALLKAVEQAHPEVTRFELTTNTLVPGNVAFYERHGYAVFERTQVSPTVVLAQLRKSAA